MLATLLQLMLYAVLISIHRTRYHSGYRLSQWETTLHCNDVSHSMSPYPLPCYTGPYHDGPRVTKIVYAEWWQQTTPLFYITCLGYQIEVQVSLIGHVNRWSYSIGSRSWWNGLLQLDNCHGNAHKGSTPYYTDHIYTTYHECCSKRKYQGRGQIITFHRYCGM